MFPHTITIYHHSISDDGADNYAKTVISGAYWVRKQFIAESGKGTARNDSYTVVMSPEQTANYGKTWNAYVNDRVIKGTGADITSWKDIPGAMVIHAIEENICGSCVDNITLIG